MSIFAGSTRFYAQATIYGILDRVESGEATAINAIYNVNGLTQEEADQIATAARTDSAARAREVARDFFEARVSMSGPEAAAAWTPPPASPKSLTPRQSPKGKLTSEREATALSSTDRDIGRIENEVDHRLEELAAQLARHAERTPAVSAKAEEHKQDGNVKANMADTGTGNPPAVLKENVTFLDRYNQIPVLNQHADGTESAETNCGYHALKNALAALIALSGEKFSEEIFRDNKFFTLFFERYCLPEIKATKFGQDKDCNCINAISILQKFAEDPEPPAELAAIQRLFKANPSKLAILFVTMGARIQNIEAPTIELVCEVMKLYDFANRKGPVDLVCAIASTTGTHWYTVALHKGADGKMHYTVCDSADNNHQKLQFNAPVVKLGKFFDKCLKDPDGMMVKALNSVVRSLSLLFKLIGTSKEGNIIKRKGLPFHLNIATAGYMMMRDLGWLKSSDPKQRIYVSIVHAMLNYFAKATGDVTCQISTEECEMIRGCKPEVTVQEIESLEVSTIEVEIDPDLSINDNVVKLLEALKKLKDPYDNAAGEVTKEEFLAWLETQDVIGQIAKLDDVLVEITRQHLINSIEYWEAMCLF